MKIVITLFGQTNQITCKLLRYAKPFIQIETPQGTRIINENAVKEVIPLEQNYCRILYCKDEDVKNWDKQRTLEGFGVVRALP